MEYSQTCKTLIFSYYDRSLNPYSNGILTDEVMVLDKNEVYGVLILILMEYSQTRRR